MENQWGLDMPRPDSKIMGEKRGSSESGYENQHGPRKRVKMRDLESVCRPGGINSHHPKTSNNKQGGDKYQYDVDDKSQVTEVPVMSETIASQAEKTGRNTFPFWGTSATRPLDLNTEMYIPKDKAYECSKKSDKQSLLREHEREPDAGFVTSRGIGVDLNTEDISSSMNQDALTFFPYKNHNQLKPRDISECASSTGPLEENDPLRVWKEMKQNGFLSSSHGGIPIPKQRGRKTKNDVLKKKMEIAKREQVDRFTKIAAPSGLLNELNPGIINHVRNRKQVHSIIEALVRSERHENSHGGNKQGSHVKSGSTDIGNRKDSEITNDSSIQRLSLPHEDGPPNSFSCVRQIAGYPTSIGNCPLIVHGKGGESAQSMAERLSEKNVASQSTIVNEEDALTLKLSSSTKMSENEGSISNEDSASYLSVKAATVASQWLELLQQDIKGRLSALKRSKKRVRAVISTELPFLLSREFSYDQENNPYTMKISADGFSHTSTLDMHRSRWNRLFDQMEKALSEEEKQLESWLNQVKEMQVHCDQGLQHTHWNTGYGVQQVGTLDSELRSQKLDNSERELAVRAAAASIYSTCNFLMTQNISCF
ncbi:cation-transporting ATPase [Parasponia andersonii]|uniref:Cation-transporting ATPase n=1 Tax=Parasponia andersonii TaxID=3476 RepID=A0A2P5AEI4_PARAD|nr:cation-transporting ATPase [Parasponia andersonii]